MNFKDIMVIGETIDQSTVIYKKDDAHLIKGLKFADDNIKWFDVQHFGNFHCGLAALDTGHSFGYIDRNGEYVIDPIYLIGDDFSEDLSFVSDHSETILLSSSGMIVKKFGENYVTNKFSDGYALISRINSTGKYKQDAYIDSFGDVIIPFGKEIPIHSPASFMNPNDEYACGLFRFEENEKYGFKNLQNEIVIPAIYDIALKFSEGLSAVKKDNRSGFIDTEGKRKIPFEFQITDSFSEGLASVMINEKIGCINKKGELIIPFEFDALGEFVDGEIEFCLNNFYGLMKKNLEIVVPCRYDSITHFHEGICEFSMDMKRGVLDRFGNELRSEYLIGSEYNKFN